MTRKDYVLISQAIYRAHLQNKQVSDEARDAIVWELADALHSENPRFERERFVTACRTGSK